MPDRRYCAGMRGVPETILVAPDSFKGTFTAAEVADAIACGMEDAGHTADRCPLADGGEGTMEALGAAHGAQPVTVTAHDPLGRELEATFMLAGPLAFVDTAAASGLHLVAVHERDPLVASTYGTGELLAAAAAAGARTIHLGVGGSATSDGGAGAIRALREAGGLSGLRLIVLCDVRTPFEDAARVFGPQKGAGPDDVRRLTRRLAEQAQAFAREGRDPRGRAMTGGAGGLSGGLWAAFGAELVPGAAFVLDAVGFDARMRAARCVITGEGCLDEQSLVGKLVSEVATRARQAGVPCHVVCGTRRLDAMGARVLDLERILEATDAAQLRAAGRKLAELV
ncbi:MAG TPA: glycerate kinase [Solirubrobacteraceae bacterium]|nr:glycerate kinase [Solirubrobacteraceae bacterium]